MDRNDAESRRRAEARRERLSGLMAELTESLADEPEPDIRHWRDHLSRIADELVLALDDHIHDTEGPNGFFEEMLENAPRLSDRVDALRDDHRTLYRDATSLRAALDHEPTIELVADARQAGTSLLDDLRHHHDLGAELLYECYWIDVATGD